MGKKDVTGYIYENGMWYEMYKTCPRKPVSEEYVIEHYDTTLFLINEEGDK